MVVTSSRAMPKEVKIWDAASHNEVRNLCHDPAIAASTLRLSPDGRTPARPMTHRARGNTSRFAPTGKEISRASLISDDARVSVSDPLASRSAGVRRQLRSHDLPTLPTGHRTGLAEWAAL